MGKCNSYDNNKNKVIRFPTTSLCYYVGLCHRTPAELSVYYQNCPLERERERERGEGGLQIENLPTKQEILSEWSHTLFIYSICLH